MVLCPICNNENDDSKEYCDICGSKLNDSTNIISSQDIFIPTEMEMNDVSANETLNTYYNELKDKIKKYEEKLKNLQQDPLFEKYDELINIKEENNSLKSQIKSLNEQISKLKSSVILDEKNKIIDDLNDKIVELESLNKTYLDACNELNLKIANLKKENDEIGTLKVNLENKNNDLQNKLENMSQKEKVIIICPNCKYRHNYKSDLNFCTECGYPLK